MKDEAVSTARLKPDRESGNIVNIVNIVKIVKIVNIVKM
jgi:hypothetical protein